MRQGVVVGAVLIATAVFYNQNNVTQAQAAQTQAGGFVSVQASETEAQSGAAYWTAERLATAQPMPLPLADRNAVSEGAAQATGTSVSAAGAEPTSAGTSVAQLFDRSLFPQEAYSEGNAGEGIEPNDVGTFGAHFSSTRLIPLTADRQYPYRTVGKLFFTIPNQGNFVCSASVFNYRLIATAGHCVSDGNGHFYTNWVFIPAYRDGVAPYQAWNWNTATTTNDWHFGGGGVPNAADYAIIAVSDRVFGTKLTKIGRKTGFLGWQTLSLSQNHTTMLGYPCNLDSCEKMHQVSAGAFRNTAPNNVEYGSDARGGSSGGPWVQNFGATAVGQSGGLNTGRNRIVGITSYGYISTDPKVQGASILDSRWVNMVNLMCGFTAGNCTP